MLIGKGINSCSEKGHTCKWARIRASARKTGSPVRRRWGFHQDDLFMGSTFPISFWPGGRAARQWNGTALVEHGECGEEPPATPPGQHVDPVATILQKHCSLSFTSTPLGNECVGRITVLVPASL